MVQWILKSGLIVDGTGAAPFSGDVHIENDTITYVGPPVDNGESDGEDERLDANRLDASGLIVSPGLIDLHVHVYDGMNLHSVAPADAGLKTGVTTMLDMGSAGAMNYRTFRKYIINSVPETVFSLLNISHFGVQGHPDVLPYIGDLHDPLHFDVEGALRVIEANRDNIVGIKVRLTASLADDDITKERAALTAAREARNRSGLPLYVHHVGSLIPLEELLAGLQSGDVVTHFYHGLDDGGFTAPGGAPGPLLLKARSRGIVFDVGHGSGSFAWRVAKPALQTHGFEPDTISTDLHVFNLESPVVDMATTMSKFLYLGMSLERVIECSTLAPAKVMGKQDIIGHLTPGRTADLTILKLVEKPTVLTDSEGAGRTAARRLTAVGVFKNGVYRDCG